MLTEQESAKIAKFWNAIHALEDQIATALRTGNHHAVAYLQQQRNIMLSKHDKEAKP